MLLIVLAILLALAVLLALAYPMLKTAQGTAARPVVSSAQETLQELLAQREAAFQAIRDLKFDREVGKITEEDFVTFEAGLKQNAAEALRRLDAWERNIDQEIARSFERSFERPARRAAPAAVAEPAAVAALDRPARAEGAASAVPPAAAVAAAAPVESPALDPLEAQIAARRAQLARGTVSCPHCGRPVAAGNEFCTSCGSPVSAAPRQPAAPKGPACPSCGRPIQPDDLFCPRCGQSLSRPMRGNPVAG